MVNKAKEQSEQDGIAYLRKCLLGVEEKFRFDLTQKRIAVTHDGTMGDAVEDDWIGLLHRYLPTRYRVARAFAVDHLGHTTEQLDCVIYDAHFTPALFGEDRHLYVPAEAVYATFEIKPTVNADHLRAAAKKIASLRKLERTSAPIPWAQGVNPARAPFKIIAGLLAFDASWKDGLEGDAFREQLSRWTGDHDLDLVLTANSGFGARFDGSALDICTGDGALIRGLFRLLVALRDRATVVATDWSLYEAALK